jgi:hypothetical protein
LHKEEEGDDKENEIFIENRWRQKVMVQKKRTRWTHINKRYSKRKKT